VPVDGFQQACRGAIVAKRPLARIGQRLDARQIGIMMISKQMNNFERFEAIEPRDGMALTL
jgi:ABC-type uncharacterized transport system ATPase subunit